MDVKVLMVDHGSWSIVDGTKTAPPASADIAERQKFEELLQGAIARIVINCSASAKAHTADLAHPKAMWDALKEQYREDDVVTIHAQWQFLHSIKFETYGDIFAYGDAISTAKARLAEAGYKVPVDVVFYIFLAGIDESTDLKWTRFIHATIRKFKNAAVKPSINQLTHLTREYINLPHPSVQSARTGQTLIVTPKGKR